MSRMTMRGFRTGAAVAMASSCLLASTLYAASEASGAESGPMPIVKARSIWASDNRAGTAAATPSYTLLAWNDLGMHCMDGKDFSVSAVLPPFNNLHAQLINRSTGKLVTSGVALTYKSYRDPSGSINTHSWDKTNFWDFSLPLFGVSLAPDMGLAGNPTASTKPAPLAWNSTWKWYEAAGIPITPYDDSGKANYYPMVQVTALNSAKTTTFATAHVDLPVSDELTCMACHASRTSGNAAQMAAKPKAGWVFNPDPEKDWKLNTLRLHDQMQLGQPLYQQALAARGYRSDGLYPTAWNNGTPALCATCHASNALPGSGYAGVSAMTSAVHATHGQVVDPTSGQTLDSGTNRQTCYLCHPGSTTQCLRGAMGSAKDAQGNMLMQCESCHGNMAKVGDPARVGWLEEPTCQACHYSGKRATTVFLSDGSMNNPKDTRFATMPNVPSTGYNLYRYSTGHGGLQCEACHGPTHAEYPTTEVNDNIQSIEVQGHAGVINECTDCHATVPYTPNQGPHGLHSTTQQWVSSHGDYVDSHGKSSCSACHGKNYRGAPQSQVKMAKTFSIEDGRKKSYKAGQAVSCYDCHNGPSGG